MLLDRTSHHGQTRGRHGSDRSSCHALRLGRTSAFIDRSKHLRSRFEAWLSVQSLNLLIDRPAFFPPLSQLSPEQSNETCLSRPNQLKRQRPRIWPDRLSRHATRERPADSDKELPGKTNLSSVMVTLEIADDVSGVKQVLAHCKEMNTAQMRHQESPLYDPKNSLERF
jgi:hypothetical protein